MKLATLIFLGTGGSLGVPVIGCSCPVCMDTHPHNKRLRTSALLRIEDKQILIDCSPDFREQALRYDLNTINGIIITHAHHDHTGGLDELRIYYLRSRQPMPCLLSRATENDVRRRFYYLFEPPHPKFAVHHLEQASGEVDFLGIPVRYFSYEQLGMAVNGLRLGNLAYVTDIRSYAEDIFEHLQGVEILVISALRHTPSPMHFTVDEAIAFAKRAGARQTWLTHIAHELEQANGNLPENVRLAYDGLELDFEM